MNAPLRPQPTRILAIDPSSYGLGFALLDDLTLLDWGNQFIRGTAKNQQALQRIEVLVEWYEPEVIALEDYTLRESRRSARVQELVGFLARLGKAHGASVGWVPLKDVRIRCGGSPKATKRHIALGMAARYPELQRILPPARKIWMPEHYRMSIFDAVALGVTYILRQRQRKAA